ncbi:MAG: hypothetical protein A3J28_08840 [Acidobacteria bacterium RIFCSPLOWO2_12_FULL_60_22]|nr:MAG: hypothetical protein A3J28_08840 [Acidobacteria bacterium RIFCSPLOWO2_12_FULL_60_22]
MSIDRQRNPATGEGVRFNQPPDRAESAQGEAVPGVALEYCPNCSAKLVGHSCKLKCPRCGYFLSCSDYY